MSESIKAKLNFADMNALYSALIQLDAYEQVVPGVDRGARIARVPYQLGATRRIIVKNMAALRGHLVTFEESRLAVVREIWPDKPEDKQITPADDPVNHAHFMEQMQNLYSEKEEVEMWPLPAAVIYSDNNDFPVQALTDLEARGLISD